MVMVPQQVLKGRLTLADYEQLPDDQDYEIIEGVLSVSPRPRPRHQVVALTFASLLAEHVREPGRGLVVPDADLIIDEQDTYISPDIMVFLGDRAAAVPPDDWIRFIPNLIVEVASPGTERYDRETKARLYAGLGVEHYWRADPQRREVVECVLDAGGQYLERTVRAPDPFVPQLFPDLAIDLDHLFRE